MWRLSTNREYLGIVLCLFCYTVDATSQEGAVGGLQEALESQGWQSTTMPDGSRIFTRPGSTAVEPAQVVDTEPPRPLSDSLLKSLQQQGWQTTTDAGGNTAIKPPAGVVEAPPLETVVSAEADASVAGSLLEALNRQGWQITRGTDGSYSATHPAVSVVPKTSSGVGPARDVSTMDAVEPRVRPAPPASLAEQLDAALRRSPAARFWRSSAGPDGSVILEPLSQAAAESGSATACAGIGVPAAIVALPVSNPDDAGIVATRWLAATDMADVALVGRIRAVPRAFMVSIVRRAAPHTLLQQVAIRARDGHVVVVD